LCERVAHLGRAQSDNRRADPFVIAGGVAALVLGILGIACVLPVIGSIIAIVLGKMGMTKAEQGLANNGGMAKAGFILGIVGLVLGVLVFLIYIIAFAAAFTASPSY